MPKFMKNSRIEFGKFKEIPALISRRCVTVNEKLPCSSTDVIHRKLIIVADQKVTLSALWEVGSK